MKKISHNSISALEVDFEMIINDINDFHYNLINLEFSMRFACKFIVKKTCIDDRLWFAHI